MCADAVRPNSTRCGREGMALIGAIAFLVLFAMLGTAYIGYMSLEFEESGNYLHELRARRLAADGVYAAIGEMQNALAEQDPLPDAYHFELAAYRQEGGEAANYPQPVNVRVQDEAARVNLNFAALPVLRALGLEAGALDALESLRSRPGPNLLVNVDDLRTRDFVNAQKFRALDTDVFTVYTAEDPRQPHSYINLNSAAPRVLSALFAIDLPEARTLAAKRPFQSWADVLQKVGREPASFNVPVPRYAPRDMPASVALDSTCYRLSSRVEFDMPGGTGRPIRTGVEAVVLFHQDGSYTIRYWKERRGADVEAQAPAAQAEPPAPDRGTQQPQSDQKTQSPAGKADTEPAAEPRTT